MKFLSANIALLALLTFAGGVVRGAVKGPLADEVAQADRAADVALAAIATPDELRARQNQWRTAWLKGLGGLPAEKTPLRAQLGPVVPCAGFTLQNVLFETLPGVYAVGHLFLPTDPAFKPPYPCVMMPLGHSDNGILNPRYAAHAAMTARAGLAVFAWDPLSQGERRQSAPKYDYTDNCSTEHARLGARGWLVGWNFARFRIWEAIRAVDYICTRPEIDASRLGVAGTSGGGTESAFLQALDARIKAAFPNCYISSFRAVVGDRGCHDAEQFFHGQLVSGVNHAALLALGQPRVALATGSRWRDYFPQRGAEETFAAFTNLTARLGFKGPFWHFHCDGPHGLPPATRAAQVDWMRHALLGGPAPKNLAAYWALGVAAGGNRDDPAVSAPLPFPPEATFFTKTRQVRDLPGFRSLYALIAERATALAAERAKARLATPGALREIVRRRAAIRPLDEILRAPRPLPEASFQTDFTWWYLRGPYGCVAENRAAVLALLGRSAIGDHAERILATSAAAVAKNGGTPILLRASGWDCIAAAHAYAAEPHLFSGVELADRPPSWTTLASRPDPTGDSMAIAVWGALEDYDWPDLVPANESEKLLTDGKMRPSCVWPWKDRPIEVVTEFGAEREIGGVRILSGRSWNNCCVKRASFYALGKDGRRVPLAEHVEFRPANTYKELFATWPPATCRAVVMVIEDTYDFKYNYYAFYTNEATKHIQEIFETPPYQTYAGPKPTVQIAELGYFGREVPADLPLPNADGSIAYPEARLVRDWAFQSCAVSNVSHCANVEPDTTKPDPLGEDVSTVVTDAAWKAKRLAMRKAFLAQFRKDIPAFLYVKHLVMGNSIFHATDDMSDASFVEWKSVPDYRGGSQLIRATINADGSVSQEVLVDESIGIIRDPVLSFDAKKVLFAKRRALEVDDYHLWTYEFATRKLTQLTFAETVRKESIPGQTNDFKVICSDIEPCWLPDGSILFQSTRCAHSVDCWPLPVSNLFRCDADGKNIRRIGFDQVQTFYPHLMNDGRVSFTRWEYNDRNAAGIQQVCAMNPDGTRQSGLFGNNSEFPFSIIHAIAIPGSQKLMALSCGHHVAQKGRLVELDPTGPDDYDCNTYDPRLSVWAMKTNATTMHFPSRTMQIAFTPWDNECGPTTLHMPGMHYLAGAAMDCSPGRQKVKMPHHFHYNVFDMHTQYGPQWAYPCPIDTNRFLVSFMPEGCRYYRGPYSSRFGIYAMTADGRRELLAFDWGNHCMQPIILKPRTPPKRTLRSLDYRKGFGHYYVQDVYEGLPVKNVKRGAVKRLRVVALEYRPVHNGWNWQFGRHSTQGKIGTPIAVGNGAYDVKHVFGEVDVEEDGSCSFLVPARAPVYFQLVDAEGCVIQTMRSWSTLMPGEFNGCIGCHEHPREASRPTATLALRKPAQKLKPCNGLAARHPLIERLEKEGPLASLANWMGVNRPRPATVEECGEGFSFTRTIQPILDHSCIACHGEGSRIDLRGVPGELPPSDDKSMRRYTKAYLALADRGRCSDNINFANGMAFAPFKPAYSFGACRSKWYKMLRAGHPDANGKPRVALSDEDLRTLALWIDLCVPFAGSYTEANAWDPWHLQRYLYTYDKRLAFHWLELNEIRRSYGLAPVPLEGFVPNIAEPRKQKRWDE